MELDFWHDKWEKNEIGFHLDAPHPWLVNSATDLGITEKQTVFVPLCGKTHDIDFLLQQGCHVVANELSELAVQSLFDRLQLTPEISEWLAPDSSGAGENSPTGKRYQAGSLTVYVGDFFKLTAQDIQSVNGDDVHWVYDRAALVALPLVMRQQYSQALSALCPKAKQILMTLDYDQTQMAGPPFSVSVDEVNDHYSATYEIDIKHQQDIIEKEPRFKQRGLSAFYQRLYCLTPK